MNYLKALLFGIVEGITELLPISSTAHMMILNSIFSLEVSSEFYSVFEVVIQLAAAISIFLVFFKKIWPFGNSNNPLGKGIFSIVKKDKFFLWIKIAIACMPAIIYELFLDDYFTLVNDANKMFVIGCSLIAVGIVFIIVEKLVANKNATKTKTDHIAYIDALIIGLAQLVAALFPGVSRSGTTIIAGLLLGISRACITDFTFELSIPVMFGASLMEIIKCTVAFSFENIMILLIGCLSAFIFSALFIKIILDYIRKHNFVVFGVYRIIMGIIVLLFLI